MIRAKNVMSRKITTVTEGVNIKHVMRLLAENKVTGVPVVSEDMHLLGIITEKDILKALLYGKDVKSKTAGELMTSHIVTFEEDEDLRRHQFSSCLALDIWRTDDVSHRHL